MRYFIALAFPLGIVLAACPAKGPKVPEAPAVCTPFTETRAAEDHCSVDQADCEKTLSALLQENHSNRCPVPPCTGFSAYTACAPTGDECELGDGSIGQRFTTTESLACQ